MVLARAELFLKNYVTVKNTTQSLCHWLYPATMHKIQNISENYICFGKSGMETAVSKGFFKGRPYSGTAVLVRSSFKKAVGHVETSDRIVTVQISWVINLDSVTILWLVRFDD